MASLSKIDAPPAAEHWARMQHPDVQKTARKLFAFLRGTVTWNYNITRQVAKFYVEDRIARQVAVKIVSEKSSPLGRRHNLEAIHAFYDLVERSPIVGIHAFAGLVDWMPIGPKAFIPIKPMAVTKGPDNFVLHWLNAWSSNPFDQYQASLYMTILERSIFRLTDFENSPGRIIFLPKSKVGAGEWQRSPVVWNRGQFPLLSEKELNDQIRVFAESKEVARIWFRDYLDRKGPH